MLPPHWVETPLSPKPPTRACATVRPRPSPTPASWHLPLGTHLRPPPEAPAQHSQRPQAAEGTDPPSPGQEGALARVPAPTAPTRASGRVPAVDGPVGRGVSLTLWAVPLLPRGWGLTCPAVGGTGHDPAAPLAGPRLARRLAFAVPWLGPFNFHLDKSSSGLGRR